MTRTRRAAIVVAVVAASHMFAHVAYGDPPAPMNLHIRTPSEIKTDGGSDLRLPPGYFLDESTHDKLDAEMRRLQTQETRLIAENQSLRGTLAGWQPGLYTVGAFLIVGIALGAYLEHKL